MQTSGTSHVPRRRPRSFGRVLQAALAEFLILVGVGVALFVGWSAWWTDLVGVQRQRAIAAELAPPTAGHGGAEHRTAPPVLESPGERAVFGTLHVPRFGPDFVRPIAEGTDRRTVLNTIGLGHYVGTAMPGGAGNVGIAGHRVTYGKPLVDIAELQPGDPVIVRVADPERSFDIWYVYRVTGSRVVSPSAVEVVAPVPSDPERAPAPEERLLTLTACHPKWSAAQRYITHATFDYWMEASAGTPRELLQ